MIVLQEISLNSYFANDEYLTDPSVAITVPKI